MLPRLSHHVVCQAPITYIRDKSARVPANSHKAYDVICRGVVSPALLRVSAFRGTHCLPDFRQSIVCLFHHDYSRSLSLILSLSILWSLWGSWAFYSFLQTCSTRHILSVLLTIYRYEDFLVFFMFPRFPHTICIFTMFTLQRPLGLSEIIVCLFPLNSNFLVIVHWIPLWSYQALSVSLRFLYDAANVIWIYAATFNTK